MLFLLSPAKTLDFSPNTENAITPTTPHFSKQAYQLATHLKTISQNELKKLMGLSDNLALLNTQRYQDFEQNPPLTKTKSALLAFKGAVYQALGANDFSKAEMEYTQKHLSILSGLYGTLQPFDQIQPYRLEMGTRLKTETFKNLYDFWGRMIGKHLQNIAQHQQHKSIVNLASKEYFKAVDLSTINIPFYTLHFKERKGDNYKTIGVHAKKARGKMCRFAIKNQLKEAKQLQKFAEDGYIYNQELSDNTEWVFTRG